MVVHLAVQSEEIDCVWLLFNRGADLRCRDIRGRTPLNLAYADEYISKLVIDYCEKSTVN